MNAARKNAGFSLLEVLVALTILALALGSLLGIFSGAAQGTSLSVKTRQALDLAQSRLDVLDASGDYRGAQGAGESETGFTWRESVEALQLSSTANPHVETVRVKVQISWQEGQRTRSLTLQTLRLVART
jgi:general secretion pathway protein I